MSRPSTSSTTSPPRTPSSSSSSSSSSPSSSSSSSEMKNNKNRKSNNNNNSHHHHHQQQQRQKLQDEQWNIVRLCGWSQSPCGYCHGERSYIVNGSHKQTINGHGTIKSSSSSSTTTTTENKSIDTTSTTTIMSSSSSENITTKDSHNNPTLFPKTTNNNTTSSDQHHSNPPSSPPTTTPSSHSSRSYGTIFSRISPIDYQNLINSGWRRSGRHIYKPDNWNSCCPALSIRLPAAKFKMSASQKKIWKRMDKFVTGSVVENGGGGGGGGGEDESGRSHDETGGGGGRGGQCKKARLVMTKKQQLPKNKKDEGGSSSSHGQNIKNFETLMEEHIMSLSLIRELDSCTLSIVKDLLLQHDETYKLDNDKNKNTSMSRTHNTILDDTILTKLCHYKFRKNYKHHPQKPNMTTQQHDKNDHDNDDDYRTCCIYSSIAAAISGRSRGVINRERLVNDLSSRLLSSSSLVSLKTTPSDDESSIRLLSIEPHERSGQINILLRVNVRAATAAAKGDLTSDGNNDDDDDLMQCSVDDKNDDPHDDADAYLARILSTNNGNKGRLLTVTSYPSHISARDPEVHRLFSKYQHAVHGDDDPFVTTTATIGSSVNNKQQEQQQERQNNNADDDDAVMVERTTTISTKKRPPLSSSSSSSSHDENETNNTTPSTSTPSNIKKSYQSFRGFLCDSPLPTTTTPPSGNTLDPDGYDLHLPYGSYHQHYRLNNHLIAVGVIDILPHGLSSVYSLYDPLLSQKLQLGTYTALREIEWVRRASQLRNPEMKYYYLGYYIHACPKMTYKANFRPSELLCPKNKRGVWVDARVGMERLERCSPVRYCCGLVESDDDDDEQEKEGGVANNEDNKQQRQRFLIQHQEQRQRRLTVDSMLIDVGGSSPSSPNNDDDDDVDDDDDDRLSGRIVRVNMLNPYGRRIVEPLIEEFVDEVGVDMSRRCIVKL